MSTEYHGWIVLATSQGDWDDGDLERAFDRVQQLLTQLAPEEGHSALLTSAVVFPRMVYLSGHDVECVDKALSVMRSIAVVFDGAYGEVVEGDASSEAWFPCFVKRHVLADGRISTST